MLLLFPSTSLKKGFRVVTSDKQSKSRKNEFNENHSSFRILTMRYKSYIKSNETGTNFKVKKGIGARRVNDI